MGQKKVKKNKTPEPIEVKKDTVKTAVAPVATLPQGAPKKVRRGKKRSRGGNYAAVAGRVNPGKLYGALEAIRLAKETSFVKFDATIEAHLNLGLDVSKDDQKVRVTLVLPHGTGRQKKILAFVPIEAVNAARLAGVDIIGDDQKIEEIGKGTIDFDVVVAEPSFMAKLSKVAKVLGPKGLMPNPKSGTVSPDPVKAIGELKKGRVELKTETGAPLLHTVIGKKSFDDQKLLENLQAVLSAVKAAKPAKTKGVFLQGLTLSATMGPGVRVDLTSLS